MTGNTNKWRAPLAGLASLAMVATMGVAAGTAMADDRQSHTVTFKLDTQTLTVTVPDGASVADAVHAWSLDGAQAPKTSISGSIDYKDNFTGWGDFDFLAPVNSNVTVQGTKATTKFDSDAQVLFTDTATNGWLTFPDGTQTGSFTRGSTTYSGQYYQVPAQGTLGKRVPVDTQADGKLVTKWNVDYFAKDGIVQHLYKGLADLSTVDTSTSAGGLFVVTPADYTTAANTLTVQGNSKGYPIGAYADRVQNGNYTADVLKGTTVKLPGSWVNASGAGYTSPNSLKDGNTSYAFGADYAVSGDVTLTASAETTTSYKVTFLGADGGQIRTYDAKDDSQDDLEGAFLAKTDREDISKITIPNFVVKGWKADVQGNITDTDTGHAFTNSEGLSYHLFTSADLDHASFSGNVTFTPVQGGTTGTVKVTFRDANYVGKHDTVVVDAKGGEYLSSDKFPTWTRDGYVLAGFYYSDGNGNTDYAAGKEFTTNSLIGEPGSYWQNNFTVTAKWEKVDATVLDAALEYIKPATAKAYFTAETYGKFNDVYTKVSNEKKQLEYVSSNNKVSDADAAKLVTELKAGWEQLKFNAEGNPTISALDFRKNPFVFRLHKDGLRLYSQTPSEIYAAQKSGWTVDNGYLFRGAPKAASKDSAIKSLVDFTEAAKVVSGGSAQAELAKKLDAIADPIVDTIYRYSSPNGTDWVYTSNTTEMKSLDRGGWNNEGIAFVVVPTFGGTPVVRFAKGGQHLMSTGATEQASLVRNGWTREGVAFRGL